MYIHFRVLNQIGIIPIHLFKYVIYNLQMLM